MFIIHCFPFFYSPCFSYCTCILDDDSFPLHQHFHNYGRMLLYFLLFLPMHQSISDIDTINMNLLKPYYLSFQLSISNTFSRSSIKDASNIRCDHLSFLVVGKLISTNGVFRPLVLTVDGKCSCSLSSLKALV